MNVETVYPEVKKIIADVLVLDEDEVSLDKRLINDLGAESIDFLDLIFQLERKFNVKIPRGQLEENARGVLSQEEYESNGVLTEKGLVALKEYLNEVPESYFKSAMKVNEIPTLFTVETFCKIVLTAPKKEESAA